MNDGTPQQPPTPETDELQGMLRESVEQVRSVPVPEQPIANSLDKAQRKIKKAVVTHRRRVLFALAGCAAMLLATTSYCVVHFWEPFRSVAVSPEGWYNLNTPAGNDVLGVDDGWG